MCNGYFFGLEVVTLNLALHMDFGLVITFVITWQFLVIAFLAQDELSGGRELPHIAEF